MRNCIGFIVYLCIMPTTVRDYIEKAKIVQNSIKGYVDDIALIKENEITNLNIIQIENSKGNDNQFLKNTNSKLFKGVYSLTTQSINPSKTAGSLYTFFETGDFLNNFNIEVKNNKMNIYSTGTGSGLKKSFFDGYPTIYGLTTENQRIVNYEIIYPELMKFIKTYL